MKKQLLALLFAAAGLFPVMAQEDGGHKDWRGDVEFLARELPEKHFNLFAVKSERKFRRELAKVARKCRDCSKTELALRLQQVIAGMGDTHTSLNIRQALDAKAMFPLGLVCFGDKYVLLNTQKRYDKWLGWNLVAVDGMPIRKVERRFCSLVTVDNVSNVRMTIPHLLPFCDLHNLLGTAKGRSAVMTFEKDGRRGEVEMEAGPLDNHEYTTLQPESVAWCQRNKRYLFSEKLFEESGIYYVQYNKCWNRELEERYGNKELAAKLPSFAEFAEQVLATVKSGRASKLVFDLRYNSGGNSAPFTELVERLIPVCRRFPDLKIYCVIGRSTFSSGILNALDLKFKLGALLVGEQTAGKPNHFGEVRGFVLPESELQVGYSTKYFKMTDGDGSSLVPDVAIDLTLDEYMEGRDPVTEWIGRQ